MWQINQQQRKKKNSVTIETKTKHPNKIQKNHYKTKPNKARDLTFPLHQKQVAVSFTIFFHYYFNIFLNFIISELMSISQ